MPNFYGPRSWGPNYLNIFDVSYVSLSEYDTYSSKRGGEFVYFATRYPCVVKGRGWGKLTRVNGRLYYGS